MNVAIQKYELRHPHTCGRKSPGKAFLVRPPGKVVPVTTGHLRLLDETNFDYRNSCGLASFFLHPHIVARLSRNHRNPLIQARKTGRSAVPSAPEAQAVRSNYVSGSRHIPCMLQNRRFSVMPSTHCRPICRVSRVTRNGRKPFSCDLSRRPQLQGFQRFLSRCIPRLFPPS
jgi:hypothetical protein